MQSFFYNLLSTALNVIASIAEQLNKLPFISFDFSGITSQANDYASKAAALQANKGEYKSLTDAFNSGFNTFETFKDGWDSDAFNSGAAWGDSVGDKISGLLDGFGGNSNIPNLNDYADLSNYGGAGNTDIGAGLNDIGNGLNDIGSGVKDTAGNTGAIKDSLEITEEDLKYLRDLAERDVINRFTTAAISVNLGGVTNNVNNGMDLDGIIDKIATGVTEAVEVAAEGVHV
ncbi:phage tail protein [Candidatus Arthromitus sp. SFB-mouse]|uniref:phage tail protein n=1 Tax=Candidatus Arthromitus sp. SFB-mouse TaxID=49118 RepID=UPI001FA6C86A|nr:phage tail protein [Candidatus Arthromitus sp. SFB-mouse]